MTGPGDAANAVENAQREQIRTGADIQAFNKRLVAEVAKYISDIELRKWAVRRAVETLKPVDGLLLPFEIDGKAPDAKELDALKQRYLGKIHVGKEPTPLVTFIAESLYAFVTAPISEKDTGNGT